MGDSACVSRSLKREIALSQSKMPPKKGGGFFDMVKDVHHFCAHRIDTLKNSFDTRNNTKKHDKIRKTV